MPQYCSVPGYTNSGGHRYPSDSDLRLKWRVAVRRIDPKTKQLWRPGKDDVVCRSHFTPEDYAVTLLGLPFSEQDTETGGWSNRHLHGERRRLKADAVPSVFTHTSTTQGPSRPKRRRQQRETTLSESTDDDVQMEVVVDTSGVSTVNDPLCDSELCDTSFQDVQVQCNLCGKYSIDMYINNSKAVHYYTGFQTYEHFMYFFNSLGPAAYELNYQCISLSPKDQLFLTLMKLRQAKEDVELSLFFNLSESTVSQIIVTWINFLYFQLREMKIWPSRETIDQHMPEDFGKKFGTTRVILDATETPIQKPSHVDAQSVTWSSYKHRNTIKIMIGCTPRGAVSFISDSFGDSSSDQQIIEKSPLLDPSEGMFNKKDSIMADRGIMVQDLFAAQDVHVNTPTTLKGKSQLEPHEIVKDCRIASKRIHVERIIGLSKTFKILKVDLPPSKVMLGSRIVYVCFAISNFRNSTVKESA